MTKREKQVAAALVVAWLLLRGRSDGPARVERLVFKRKLRGYGLDADVPDWRDILNPRPSTMWVTPDFRPPPDPEIEWWSVGVDGDPDEKIGGEDAEVFRTWDEFWRTGDYPEGAERVVS